MAEQADLQTLLRFLTQDAKVSLADAMRVVKDLHKAGLNRYAATVAHIFVTCHLLVVTILVLTMLDQCRDYCKVPEQRIADYSAR